MNFSTSTALDGILSYLRAAQGANGEFPSLEIYPEGHPLHEAGWVYTDPSPFITANIVACLRHIDGKEAIGIRSKAIQFLKSQMEPHGLWRFWKHGGKTFNVPTDADDTALCSFALSLEKAAPGNRKIFLRNRNAAGQFLTWFFPRPSYWLSPRLFFFLKRDLRRVSPEVFQMEMLHPDDAEPAVVANILMYLGQSPQTIDSVKILVKEIAKGPYPMQFYDDELVVYYHLARAYGAGVSGLVTLREKALSIARARLEDPDIFNRAIAVSVLGYFGAEQDVFKKAITRLEQDVCETKEWRPFPYFNSKNRIFRAGSAALTAAVVAEALSVPSCINQKD